MIDNKFILKVLLIRRLKKKLLRKPRSIYIRQLFLNRNVQGDSVLVRELREDPQYHYRYFRMDKKNFDWILDKISPKICHSRTHIRPISLVERLAITLRFLASGNSQISLALNYRVSPSSLCSILRETMKAICVALSKDFLECPTQEMWKKNEHEFSSRWNFPNCCGALDGKHIRIKAPRASGSKFFNYKSFFSIVLLAISNANYMFTAVDIGSSGSQSDGGILQRSAMGKKLETNSFGLPNSKSISSSKFLLPYVILGDSGFPLKPYLMRPYSGDWLAKPYKIFNYRLSRARMVVENSFGLLSARWRIFHTAIDANVEFAKLITLTCVILHNFLLAQTDFNNITVDRVENGNLIEGNWRSTILTDNGMQYLSHQGSNNYGCDASEVREEFKKYFLSEEGKVTWQDAYVTREN